MFAKISLTAAFFLMAAPPMACASSRVAAHQAPGICQMRGETAGVIVAQDDDSNSAATDGNDNGNDGDNDSSDNADDNQNDNDQMDQNAAGNDQNAQPSDNDSNNDSDAQQQAPQNGYSQQMNQ
jgi:hypothetical protein